MPEKKQRRTCAAGSEPKRGMDPASQDSIPASEQLASDQQPAESGGDGSAGSDEPKVGLDFPSQGSIPQSELSPEQAAGSRP